MIYLILQLAAAIQGFMSRAAVLRLAKISGIIVLVPFATIAGLRGKVGTDTVSYLNIVQGRLAGAELSLEPGFLLFIDVARHFTQNAQLVVNLFSSMFFIVVAVFMIRSARRELVFLFGYYAPQFFIMYSMNGIRIGLASAFFLLFFQCWTRRQRIAAISFGATALTFHYSIILAVALFFFGRIRQSRRHTFIAHVTSIAFITISIVVFENYFTFQFEKYAEAETFSALSGLSVIIKILFFLAFVGRLPVARQQRRRLTLVSISAILFAFGVTQFSYAGLRLLDIVSWVIPLLFMASVDPKKPMGKRYTVGLMLTGILGGISILRNVYSTAGLGDTPFIPYHFLWESVF